MFRYKTSVLNYENDRTQKKAIVLHPTVNSSEDVVMMTMKSLLKLIKMIQDQSICSKCNITKTIVIERLTAQYKIRITCPGCNSQHIWVNSPTWKEPGLIRKFVESMTISGVSFWKYKRYNYFTHTHTHTHTMSPLH